MILPVNPVKKILGYAESLRFPWLVLVTAVLFVIDLLVPDIIPFVDELLLGLVLAMLSRIRKPRQSAAASGSPAAGTSAAHTADKAG